MAKSDGTRPLLRCSWLNRRRLLGYCRRRRLRAKGVQGRRHRHQCPGLALLPPLLPLVLMLLLLLWLALLLRLLLRSGTHIATWLPALRGVEFADALAVRQPLPASPALL